MGDFNAGLAVGCKTGRGGEKEEEKIIIELTKYSFLLLFSHYYEEICVDKMMRKILSFSFFLLLNLTDLIWADRGQKYNASSHGHLEGQKNYEEEEEGKVFPHRYANK